MDARRTSGQLVMQQIWMTVDFSAISARKSTKYRIYKSHGVDFSAGFADDLDEYN